MSNKPKCGCGNTQNPDGFCDGSHNNQEDQIKSIKAVLYNNIVFYKGCKLIRFR